MSIVWIPVHQGWYYLRVDRSYQWANNWGPELHSRLFRCSRRTLLPSKCCWAMLSKFIHLHCSPCPNFFIPLTSDSTRCWPWQFGCITVLICFGYPFLGPLDISVNTWSYQILEYFMTIYMHWGYPIHLVWHWFGKYWAEDEVWVRLVRKSC